MAPPRSAFGASPSRGRHRRPGQAGSAVARVWNPVAILRARFQRWWQARLPRQDVLLLTQRNVYILPSRAGFMLAATLLVLLVASINYQLNLGYLLTFLLAGSAIASIPVAHGTLRGLTLSLAPPEPTFADRPARLQLTLSNPGKTARHGIGVSLPGSGHWVWCDVPAQGSTSVELLLEAQPRGRHALPTLTLETRFPLGLFRVWALWRPAAPLLVYPAPEVPAPPLPAGEPRSSGATSTRQAPSGEFDGVRPYRRGDPLKAIVWKKAAKTDELVSRDSQQSQAVELWLDLALSGGGSVEQRLSRLCAWVLLADEAEVDYGLRLPSSELSPAHGDAHKRRCLEALALY
jgi:uncharacterized protein (DUF58 family)